MRTLSATLEAAQRVSPQVPAVRLLIRDKQPRIMHVGDEGPSDCQMSMCTADDGALVIAKLDTSGYVKVKRVTVASTWGSAGDWDGVSWTTVESSAYPWHDTYHDRSGDVCVSNHSGTLWLFFVSSGGDDIKARSSADHGVTWSAEVNVKLTGYREDHWMLASSGNNDCWYWNDDHNDVRRLTYSGGVWGSETDYFGLESGSSAPYFGGLDVLKIGDYAYIFGCKWDAGPEAGRLVCLKYEWVRTPDYKDYDPYVNPWKVMPPFSGTAAEGWTCLWPHIIETSSAWGQSYLLSFLEKHTVGGVDMYNLVVLRSNDLDHWSDPVPVPFDLTYERRAPLGADADSVWLYVDHEAAEMRHYDASETRSVLTISHEEVLSYEIREDPEYGEVVAEVDNRDGAYDGAGGAGDSAEALRPLAQLVVDQGLVTSSGTERVESRPFYIWELARRREPGANWLRIQAFDAWQLFRLWRFQHTAVLTDKTLKWCIEEVAARVGFWSVEFDEEDDWDDTLGTLTVVPDSTDWLDKARLRAWQRWVAINGDDVVAFDERTTAMTLLRTLLSLVGGAARWGHGDSEEVLYCFIPENEGDSPTPAHTYDDGEILEGLYAEAVVWPTRARCSGTGFANEALDSVAGGAAGREVVNFITDTSMNSAAWCLVVAQSAIDDGEARGQAGHIVTRPNVCLELYDNIELSDSFVGAAGLSSVLRRVNQIRTVYDPLDGRWEQRVGLEHV